MECIYLLAFIFGLYHVTETRSIEDNLLYKNSHIPKNWKNDKRYVFQWKGDFTWNIDDDSKCEKATVPSHGRFICSSGSGLSRVMCLTECMTGYEHVSKAMVYICTNDGKWLNIFGKVVPTPHIECTKSKWEY